MDEDLIIEFESETGKVVPISFGSIDRVDGKKYAVNFFTSFPMKSEIGFKTKKAAINYAKSEISKFANSIIANLGNLPNF